MCKCNKNWFFSTLTIDFLLAHLGLVLSLLKATAESLLSPSLYGHDMRRKTFLAADKSACYDIVDVCCMGAYR